MMKFFLLLVYFLATTTADLHVQNNSLLRSHIGNCSGIVYSHPVAVIMELSHIMVDCATAKYIGKTLPIGILTQVIGELLNGACHKISEIIKCVSAKVNNLGSCGQGIAYVSKSVLKFGCSDHARTGRLANHLQSSYLNGNDSSIEKCMSENAIISGQNSNNSIAIWCAFVMEAEGCIGRNNETRSELLVSDTHTLFQNLKRDCHMFNGSSARKIVKSLLLIIEVAYFIKYSLFI